MRIEPLGDRVIIRPADAEKVSKGGIILPDVSQEQPTQGLVVEVGPGTDEVEMRVKKGDRVLYGKYSGHTVSIERQEYIIVRQDEIIGIIREDET